MSFRGDVLVMLSWCICVPFLTIFPPITCAMWSVPEVIWTAQAWPKHMFWLLSAPRNYKKTKQKSIAIWSFIFSGCLHYFGYMFWRRSNFLEQIVVYKIVCEKGAPKRWNKEWWLSPGAPWQPPSCAHFLSNKQQLSKQWTTTIAEIVKVVKQTHKMLQQNRKCKSCFTDITNVAINTKSRWSDTPWAKARRICDTSGLMLTRPTCQWR